MQPHLWPAPPVDNQHNPDAIPIIDHRRRRKRFASWHGCVDMFSLCATAHNGAKTVKGSSHFALSMQFCKGLQRRKRRYKWLTKEVPIAKDLCPPCIATARRSLAPRERITTTETTRNQRSCSTLAMQDYA